MSKTGGENKSDMLLKIEKTIMYILKRNILKKESVN